MLGCGALIALEPTTEPDASVEPGWEPTDPISFELMDVPQADVGTFDVGPPLDAPASIEPGTYRVVAGVYLATDLRSQGNTGLLIESVVEPCQGSLTVDESTARVEIAVAFTLDARCVLAIAAA